MNTKERAEAIILDLYGEYYYAKAEIKVSVLLAFADEIRAESADKAIEYLSGCYVDWDGSTYNHDEMRVFITGKEQTK